MSPMDSDDIDRESLEQDLKDLKNMIDNFKMLGVNVEAVDTILTQAIKNLDEENYLIASTLLNSAKETYKLIKQQYFIQASSILFSSLQRTILELENAGSEVNHIKNLYNKAKEMFDSGQYEEAMGYIKSAEDMAADIRDSLKPKSDEIGVDQAEIDQSQEQMERVSKTLIRVEELLQKAIDEGYSVNEAEKLYSLAEDAFDYQDYKKAESYALEAEKSLQDILEPSFLEKTQKTAAVTEIESELDRAIHQKSKFTDIVPMGIIGDAPGSEARDTSAKAQVEADVESKSPEKIEKSIKKSKSSIDDLKADLQKIMERVPTKRFIKRPPAHKDSIELDKKPSSVDLTKPKKEEEQIERIESKELDRKMEEEFEKLIHDKLEVEFEPPPEIPKMEIEQEVEEKTNEDYINEELNIEGNPEEQATGYMEILEAKISRAKEISLNVPMAERLYSIAESYFEDGEFESVIEYTKKGINTINEHAARKGLADELGLIDKEKGKRKKIEKKSSEELPPPEKAISERPLENGAVRKRDQIGDRASKKKKKITDKKAAAKIKIALKKIQKEINETKEMGIDVNEAEELIKIAVRELKSNNLVNAKNIGIEAKRTIKTTKADFVKQKALDMIKVAWKEIAEAENNGEDVSDAHELLVEARNMIKNEEYEKAAQFALKAINYFKL